MNVVILITCAKKRQAQRIARELVRHRLVACVNLTQQIKSVFWWQSNIESSDEILLIAKSKKSMIQKIVRLVKSLHSYQVPEIIALPIVGGSSDYMRWLNESVRQPV